jgi:saccharopepsin
MSVNGIWRNSYGSVMSLRQERDGRIYGSYQSTTGSTGTYYVLGYADSRDQTPERGQSLALSIFWHSIGSDPADPSWHWVSGQGGQLLGEGAERRLLLMHDMVATAAFPGQNGVGRHIDKLIFTPDPDAKIVPVAPALGLIEGSDAAGQSTDFSGEWVDANVPSIRIRPRLVDARFGFATADLILDGHQCSAWGFIDGLARQESCDRQAISLSALLDPRSGETASLSGYLELATGVASLTVFRSKGTSPELSYTQTCVDQLRFIKSKG